MVIQYKDIFKGVIFIIGFSLVMFLVSLLFAKFPRMWFYVSNIIKLGLFIFLLLLFIKNPKNQIVAGSLLGFIIFYIIPILLIVLKLVIDKNLM